MTVVRREVFERIGPFDPSFRRGEDSDWLLRVTEADIRIHVLDEVVLLRRAHDLNATVAGAAGQQTLLEVLHARMKRLGPERRTDGPDAGNFPTEPRWG